MKYLLTYVNYTKEDDETKRIVECKDDDDAIETLRKEFNIKGGRVDKKAGYIQPKNEEWLASFTPVSLLSKTALSNIFDPKYQWSVKHKKTLYNLQDSIKARKERLEKQENRQW